jgi:hypothetical protein
VEVEAKTLFLHVVCHKGTRQMLRHTEIEVPDEQRDVIHVEVDHCETHGRQYLIFDTSGDPIVLNCSSDGDREQSLAAMTRPAFPPQRIKYYV